MRTCKNCGEDFNILVEIDGKQRNLGSRKFCLSCSPFGIHNTRKSLKTGKNRLAKIDSLSGEEFNALIRNSQSIAEFLDKIKLRKSGASYVILNRRINK